jgi:putative transposase
MNVIVIEVDIDHVHIYMEIPPQISVGRAVRILKSLSARYMFKKFPYLKRLFWSGEREIAESWGFEIGSIAA